MTLIEIKGPIMQKIPKYILYFFISTIAIFLIVFLVYTQSRQKSDYVVAEPNKINIKINRFDQELYQCKNVYEIVDLLKKYPEVTDKVFKLYPDQTYEELGNQIFDWLQKPDVKELFAEVTKKFANYNDIENELSIAFTNAKSIVQEMKIPTIFFVVSGMKIEFYSESDIIIIGIDNFLGKESKFRPFAEEYRLHIYEREYIVPTCVILYLSQYVKDNSADQSLIADMLFFGRVYALAEAVMPFISKNLIFSYTKAQLANIEDNEVYIWEHFLQSNLLYKKDSTEKNIYLEATPEIPEIYISCPGEVAKWLGYKIIKSYLKNNKSESLINLLNSSDLQEIFLKSKYKPYI